MNLVKTFFIELARIFKENTVIFFHVAAAFLLPVQPLLILVGMMIILDTITGIWKSFKLKEKITSRKLSKVISKMLLYQIAIITFYVLEKHLLGEFAAYIHTMPFWITKMVALFFCTIEIMSIHENIRAAYGVNFFQTFKKILGRVQEVSKEVVAIKKDLEELKIKNDSSTDEKGMPQ